MREWHFVPNVAALLGTALAWQALSFGPAGPTVSNPSVAIAQ